MIMVAGGAGFIGSKIKKVGYTSPMIKLKYGIRQYVQKHLNKKDSYR